MADESIRLISNKLDLLIEAVSRLSPPPPPENVFGAADCFLWSAQHGFLEPILHVNRVDIALIRAVDHVRDILIDNTRRFASGLPANNTLLWGARGMGKSSLVKAVHAAINQDCDNKQNRLKLVEIHREDIGDLPKLMNIVKQTDHRFIVFCDDLSFDGDDTSYKSLKAALEGGVEGRPDNIIFYATSNRRHLLPRDMIENERSTAINPSEAVEEKVSLSDRFGLWLGFSQMFTGRLSGDDRRLCGVSRPESGRRDSACRSARMVNHQGEPLRPRCLSVHPGSRRTNGTATQGLKPPATLADRIDYPFPRNRVGSAGAEFLRTSK